MIWYSVFDFKLLWWFNDSFVFFILLAMQNSRIAREIDDRFRVDAVNFRQAGMGPIRKTYKYDPTKARPTTVKDAVSTAPARKNDT